MSVRASKGALSSLESEAPQLLLPDCSGFSMIQSCLWKHPTAKEFPFVFSWLSLLWHALLFLHSGCILKLPQASLQMKHCITEEVKPLQENAFARHLEQTQSALIFQERTCKLTLQNLGRTMVLSWVVWCSFLKKLSCAVVFLPHHEWGFYICIEEMLQTKQLEHRASKSFGRKRISCLLKSAKVSGLLWVLLSSCNNSPFLQSCGDGAVAVSVLFSWCEMLYECWGSLLELSLLVKGLILRSDLVLAQEEGRQRILFCRKLGQQVFIIVLDSPMWFAFRNELGWHCGWSLSPSQDAASDSAPCITAFPNGMKGNKYSAEEAQAIVSLSVIFSDLSVRGAQEHRMRCKMFWRGRTITLEYFQSLKCIGVTEISIALTRHRLLVVLTACGIVWFLFGSGHILILVLPV